MIGVYWAAEGAGQGADGRGEVRSVGVVWRHDEERYRYVARPI